MVSRLKQVMRILFHKKDPIAVAKAQESVQVVCLKRQVKAITEINEQLSEQVSGMAKELAVRQDGNFQEKMLNVAVDFFTGGQKSTNSPLSQNIATPRLESGEHYSDEQLMGFAEKLPAVAVEALKGMAYEQFQSTIKTQIPNISETSLKRSFEIVGAMP